MDKKLINERAQAAPDVDGITGHRRMRRNRKAEWTRRLVRENHLSVDDLIWTMFLAPGTNVEEPIDAMPGVYRLSVDKAVEAAKRGVDASDARAARAEAETKKALAAVRASVPDAAVSRALAARWR